MKTRSKAFTLVEIMIVVVIIGLLAAMAIPAFQAIRMASIEKAIKNGMKVSEEQRVAYFNWKKGKRESGGSEKTVIDDTRTIEIDGKKYVILPKKDVSETTINGKVYWLIPTE